MTNRLSEYDKLQLLNALNRAKVHFQMKAIVAAIGIQPESVKPIEREEGRS